MWISGGHLKTVQRHRRLVRQYCFRLGLYWQGLTHDLSKFSPVEFWAGVKYFQGDRSPNDAQRRDNGYSASWMHHKGRNRHHFEYWTDYGMDGERHHPAWRCRKNMWRRCSATGWPPARSTGVKDFQPGDPYQFCHTGKTGRGLPAESPDPGRPCWRPDRSQNISATYFFGISTPEMPLPSML